MTFPKKKFGEIADFKNGLNFQQSQEGVDVKFLGVGDFQDRTEIIDMSLLGSIMLDAIPKNEALLKDGDLVFVRSNGSKELVGRCLMVYPHQTPLAYTGFAIRARITDTQNATPFFVLQHIQNGLLKQSVKRQGSGTNISNLNQDILSELEIPLPPLPEQKAIADTLSTWDSAITTMERLIAAKEKIVGATIHKIVNSKAATWAHKRVDEIFSEISDKNHPEEELLSVTQDRGTIPRSMLEGRVMSPEGSLEAYKLVQCGDFIISLRSFQGGLEYSNYTGIISPAYTVLRPKIGIDTDFYRYFFKTYIFIEKYLAISVIGIRDGKQISIPDFMVSKVPLPSLSEQAEIASTLNILHKELTLLRKQLELLKRQKRGLMQKLLTGNWRVKIPQEAA